MSGRSSIISKGRFMQTYKRSESISHMASVLGISVSAVRNNLKKYGLLKSKRSDIPLCKEIFEAFTLEKSIYDLAAEFCLSKTSIRIKLRTAITHLWPANNPTSLGYGLPKPPSIKFIKVVNLIRLDEEDNIWTNLEKVASLSGVSPKTLEPYLTMVFEIKTSYSPEK